MNRENPSGDGRTARVALGFPNTLDIAASNLGFRIVAAILRNIPGIGLEQFTFPNGALDSRPGALRTEPSQRSLASMDLVLVSLSYENDALNLPVMLEAGGLPVFAAERREGHPLVVGGGALAMINPEPLACFFDLFLLGEAEAFLEQFIERWLSVRAECREESVAALDEFPPAYVPARRRHRTWSVTPGGLVADREVRLPGPHGSVADTGACDAGADELKPPDFPVSPVAWTGIDETSSAIRVPDGSSLGPAYLLELARGCRHNCRFCAASRIYAPLRECPVDVLLERARSDVKEGETVGMLSLSAGGHGQLEKLTSELAELNVRLSISSLPPVFMREEVVCELVRTGASTLTVAPETGSDRLRKLVGKPYRNEQIVRSAEMLGRAGVRRLRTYFIIGLPFEEDDDIDAIGALLAQIRRALPPTCSLNATVNAFVPKPRTPFQWAPMISRKVFRDRATQLKRVVPTGVRLRIKSYREAALQAALARGDVSWGPRLARMSASGLRVADVLREERLDQGVADTSKEAPKRVSEEVLTLDALNGPIRVGSPLPWDYLIAKEAGALLEAEWRKVSIEAGEDENKGSPGAR